MKMLTIAITVAAILSSCDSRPVDKQPSINEVVGIWECSEFPSTLLKETGVGSGMITSRIEFRRDGSCTATHFPQRSPYKFINVGVASWELIDPSMTPSGSWSIEFSGNFLQCRDDGGSLVLRYLVSGKDEISIDYKRVAQTGSSGKD